jgi:hypothetical protein
MNALRIAAEQYDSSEHDCECHPGHGRLAQQFKKQAGEARALIDAIEIAETIKLED